MKKRVLSLVLTLALCLGLAVPAMAAGEKKVVTVEEDGVIVTMDGFLREETHRYLVGDTPKLMTVYVLADHSTVTIEAMEGYRYMAEADFWAWADSQDMPYYQIDFPADLARASWLDKSYMWDAESKGFYGVFAGNELATPLEGPVSYSIEPIGADDEVVITPPVFTVSESEFAKLVPFEGKPVAADWAQETMEKAYDEELFQNFINPFEEDCARNMTRSEFATVVVNLYAAMQGKDVWDLEVSEEHPFTDARREQSVGKAYNLGIVGGITETEFGPDLTLTREQAATMLGRLAAKLGLEVPAANATTYADDAQINDWAKAGVSFLSGKGIVGGVGENLFAPQNDLTVQEAVTMAVRMLENLK